MIWRDDTSGGLSPAGRPLPPRFDPAPRVRFGPEKRDSLPSFGERANNCAFLGTTDAGRVGRKTYRLVWHGMTTTTGRRFSVSQLSNPCPRLPQVGEYPQVARHPGIPRLPEIALNGLFGAFGWVFGVRLGGGLPLQAPLLPYRLLSPTKPAGLSIGVKVPKQYNCSRLVVVDFIPHFCRNYTQ